MALVRWLHLTSDQFPRPLFKAFPTDILTHWGSASTGRIRHKTVLRASWEAEVPATESFPRGWTRPSSFPGRYLSGIHLLRSENSWTTKGILSIEKRRVLETRDVSKDLFRKINTRKLFRGSKYKKRIKISLSHILIFIGTICTYLSVDERGGTQETDHEPAVWNQGNEPAAVSYSLRKRRGWEWGGESAGKAGKKELIVPTGALA